MRYLDIAAVAQQSGVPASALRYYEEKGLIASVGRRGLRRLFDRWRAGTTGVDRAGASGRLFARRDRRHVHAGRAPADRPARRWRPRPTNWTATIQQVEFDARRAAARGRLPCAESHGMPVVPPPDAGSGGSAERRQQAAAGASTRQTFVARTNARDQREAVSAAPGACCSAVQLLNFFAPRPISPR